MWPSLKNWSVISTQNIPSRPTPTSPPEVTSILSFAWFGTVCKWNHVVGTRLLPFSIVSR